MKRIWLFAKRRWIVTTMAILVVIVGGMFGWRAWQRAAIQRALTFEVSRLWIDDAGTFRFAMHCSFDSSRLGFLDQIACPHVLYTQSPNAGWTPVLNSERSDPLKIVDKVETVRAGHRTEFSDGLNQKFKNGDGRPVTFRIGADAQYFLPWQEARTWKQTALKEFELSERLHRLPHWLSDSVLRWLVPMPEDFQLPPQEFTFDPTKRNFDFVTQRPMSAPAKLGKAL